MAANYSVAHDGARDGDAVWRRFEALMNARGAAPGAMAAVEAASDAPSVSDAVWARFETLLRERDAADAEPEQGEDFADIFDFTPAAVPSPDRAPVRLFDLRAALRSAAIAS